MLVIACYFSLKSTNYIANWNVFIVYSEAGEISAGVLIALYLFSFCCEFSWLWVCIRCFRLECGFSCLCQSLVSLSKNTKAFLLLDWGQMLQVKMRCSVLSSFDNSHSWFKISYLNIAYHFIPPPLFFFFFARNLSHLKSGGEEELSRECCLFLNYVWTWIPFLYLSVYVLPLL